MAAKLKKITKNSKCHTTTSISSNDTNERKSKKRKLELLTDDSSNAISKSDDTFETELQTNNTVVQKKARVESNAVSKMPLDKRNSAEDISELADQTMFQRIDSDLKNDLCLKLKSSFEIMKVTKRGENAKLRKKLESSDTKSKVKVTVKKDVTETKVNLRKRNIPRKKYSEETSEEILEQFSCNLGEISESSDEEAHVKKPTSVRNKMAKTNCSSSPLNSQQTSDIPLDIIQKCIKIKIKDPESLINQILSKHCTYKLINIIKLAVKNKERCGREILTGDDFDKGLLFCGEKTISACLDMPIAKKNDKPINILGVSRNKWKAKKVICQPKPQKLVNEIWLEHNPLSKDLSVLPDDLKLYFKLVTKAILISEEKSCSLALEDLKSNKKIACLVPSFVDFISSEILKGCSDSSRIPIILKAMQSLLLNPFLCFGHDSYLNTFAFVLLKCLVNPLQHFYLNWDYCVIKDTAAELLALILKRSGSRKLWSEIMFVFEAVFSDMNMPFVSHYGTIVAVNSIGISAITLSVLPYIMNYLKHLDSIDSSDYHKICDACIMQGQLIRTYYLLVSHFIKQKDFKKPSLHFNASPDHPDNILKTSNFESLLKTNFPEYFGDALVQHFPLLNFVSHNRKFVSHGRKKIQNSILNSKKNDIELKVQNKAKHLLPIKVNDLTKPVNKLRDIMFDSIPLKKHTIKFGQIMKKI